MTCVVPLITQTHMDSEEIAHLYQINLENSTPTVDVEPYEEFRNDQYTYRAFLERASPKKASPDRAFLDRVFFVIIQLFGMLCFWVDVLAESVCSPFYTIWCLIVPVICQSNAGSQQTFPPLAKGLILGVYGLGTLLIGGVVLSLLGLIPTMGCMPTALMVAKGVLVQLVGQPLASVLLVLMGLHACAALAYLMRVAISRGLLIKQAWQLCQRFEQLNKEKGSSQTCYYDDKRWPCSRYPKRPDYNKQPFQYKGRFKEILRVAFLEYTHFDAPDRQCCYATLKKNLAYPCDGYSQPLCTQMDAFHILAKSRWENVLFIPKMDGRYQAVENALKDNSNMTNV